MRQSRGSQEDKHQGTFTSTVTTGGATTSAYYRGEATVDYNNEDVTDAKGLYPTPDFQESRS